MIRYLLKIPRAVGIRPDRPRREVRVFLCVDSPDRFAQVKFEGTENDIAVVRESLFRYATGVRGLAIEEKTTPRNLAVAMLSSVMQQYTPVRIEGDEIFEPAETAIAEGLHRLGEDVAALLITTLPGLPSYDPMALAELIERLRLILARGRAITQSSQLPKNAISCFASTVHGELEAAGVDAARLATILQEAYSFLKVVELQVPQRPEQVAAVLRRLAGVLESPKNSSLQALVEALEAEWTAPNTAL
jgi:hypothetical protein